MAPITVSLHGQKPNRLDPYNPIASAAGDLDPVATLKEMVTHTIFEPLNPNTPVDLMVGKNPVDPDQMTDTLLRAIGEVMDTTAQDTVNAIFEQSLVRWVTGSTVPMDEMFVTQAAAVCKLPDPSKALYTVQADVLPTTKDVLAGNAGSDLLLASLGYTFHPRTLGFWFRTDTEFDDFKAWLRSQTALLSSVLTAQDTRMFQQFDTLTLNKSLTESLILRADDSQALDEYSFARVLVWALCTWTHQQSQTARQTGTCETSGILPFSISELVLPRTLVLVNIEAHARSSLRKITKEWDLVTKSLRNPVKLVNPGQLSKLTTLARAQAKAISQAANSQSNRQHQAARSAKVVFRKRPTKPVDIYRSVMRVLKSMGKVNYSLNAMRQTSTSFVRANRRNPDDHNKPGKSISHKYMPDIHVYLDTSGSISENNYQDTIKMLIRFAQRLNVDLYFTSFSHVMSTPVRLRIQGRSVTRVWQQFTRIPKVSGGTDYEQIWDFINAHPKLGRRLNLVITDFEWCPNSYHVDVPQNLYYIPISVEDYHYSYLRHSAMNFVEYMRKIDPTTGSRILGMTK